MWILRSDLEIEGEPAIQVKPFIGHVVEGDEAARTWEHATYLAAQ